jgi:hypothetical protein
LLIIVDTPPLAVSILLCHYYAIIDDTLRHYFGLLLITDYAIAITPLPLLFYY